jgi:hypothetical protein
MSKRLALFLAVALVAIGCTTTKGPTDYKADSPPPITKGDPKAKDADTSKLPPSNNHVSADNITADNLLESVRRLDADERDDKKAMTKAGQ